MYFRIVNRFFLLTVLLMTCGVVLSQDLSAHKWKNRILIVQANEDTPLLSEQLAEFQDHMEALEERRLVIYKFIGEEYTIVNYQKEESQSYRQRNNQLNSKFMTEAVFRVLLIGLDGGVKLEEGRIVSSEDIFDLIDSMPMRRAEMERRKTN